MMHPCVMLALLRRILELRSCKPLQDARSASGGMWKFGRVLCEKRTEGFPLDVTNLKGFISKFLKELVLPRN